MAVALALFAGACASDDLPETSLGNTSDLLVAVETAPPVAQRVPVVTDASGLDPFLLGDWVGHAEDLFGPYEADGSTPTYVFPSGSSEIYLHLDFSLGIDGTSHIRFGQREAPVPQAGAPYGNVNYYMADIFRIAGSPTFPPVEGIAYPLWQQALLLAGEDYPAIGFVYAPEAAFDQWCPLQQSLPAGGGSFNCAGAGGFGGGDPDAGEPCTVFLEDGSERQMDCNYVSLCTSLACECDELGCRAQYNDPANELWISREGDQLIGHLSRAVFDHGLRRPMPVGTLRFDRAEP